MHQGLTGGHVSADATARNHCLAGLWCRRFFRMSKNSCVPVMHVNELANQGYRTLKGVAVDAGKAYLMLCRCSHPCHMESLNVGDSL